MKIRIEYKLINDHTINNIILTPKEYFDELTENENFEDDGIPKYNNPKIYIEIKKLLIKGALLLLLGG